MVAAEEVGEALRGSPRAAPRCAAARCGPGGWSRPGCACGGRRPSRCPGRPAPGRRAGRCAPGSRRRRGRRRRAAGAAARSRRRCRGRTRATSPGPWLIGANVRTVPPPVDISTTRTGADGPIALAIGTTVSWRFAGSRRTAPEASSPSASAVSAAQPSATVAARIERRSGSAHLRPTRSPGRSAGGTVAAPATPGTTSPAGRDPDEEGHAGVEAAQHLGVGGVDLRAAAGVQPGQRADRVRPAAGGRAPVDVLHRTPLAAHRVGEHRQPDVDHRDLVGQDDRGQGGAHRAPPEGSGRATAWPAAAASSASSAVS